MSEQQGGWESMTVEQKAAFIVSALSKHGIEVHPTNALYAARVADERRRERERDGIIPPAPETTGRDSADVA